MKNVTEARLNHMFANEVLEDETIKAVQHSIILDMATTMTPDQKNYLKHHLTLKFGSRVQYLNQVVYSYNDFIEDFPDMSDLYKDVIIQLNKIARQYVKNVFIVTDTTTNKLREAKAYQQQGANVRILVIHSTTEIVNPEYKVLPINSKGFRDFNAAKINYKNCSIDEYADLLQEFQVDNYLKTVNRMELDNLQEFIIDERLRTLGWDMSVSFKHPGTTPQDINLMQPFEVMDYAGTSISKLGNDYFEKDMPEGRKTVRMGRMKKVRHMYSPVSKYEYAEAFDFAMAFDSQQEFLKYCGNTEEAKLFLDRVGGFDKVQELLLDPGWIKCPECGHYMSEHSHYCGFCGQENAECIELYEEYNQYDEDDFTDDFIENDTEDEE